MNTPAIDELFSFSQDAQKAWFNAQQEAKFLAKRQIKAGAVGITCQKLGEAEVMVDAGIEDILIATNIIGAARSGKLAKLQQRVSLKVCADNLVSLRAYSEAGQSAQRPIRVLIECDLILQS